MRNCFVLALSIALCVVLTAQEPAKGDKPAKEEKAAKTAK